MRGGGCAHRCIRAHRSCCLVCWDLSVHRSYRMARFCRRRQRCCKRWLGNAIRRALTRVATISVAGVGWWLLLPASGRFKLRSALLLRFIREGVNTLLPTPVTLPPGRAQLTATPATTGSAPIGDATIGINLVASRAGCKAQSETAMMTSGLAATSSRASFGISSELPIRTSTTRLRPSTKPRWASSGKITLQISDRKSAPAHQFAGPHLAAAHVPPAATPVASGHAACEASDELSSQHDQRADPVRPKPFQKGEGDGLCSN